MKDNNLSNKSPPRVYQRVYQWSGINHLGEKIQGTMAAKNKFAVIDALVQQEILHKKIVKQSKIKSYYPFYLFYPFPNKKLGSQNLAYFTRQLATMLTAGIPITQALNLISKGQKNAYFRSIIEDLQQQLSRGLSLREALERSPEQFNSLFCNLVDAGEKSGSLDLMLQKIADYQEKLNFLKKKIKAALVYPLAILSVALIITSILLLVVVPQFEQLFHDFGAQLPTITRLIIHGSKLLAKHSMLILLSTPILFYAIIFAPRHSKVISRLQALAILKLPILGELITKKSLSHFARTFAITYAAGIQQILALEMAAKASNHPIYEEAVLQISKQVASGLSIHRAMANTGVFPELLTQMIAIGEESGTLETMLNKVALIYEVEVDNTIHVLSRLIEPVIMSILGIVVGGLVIAMYLPIFQLGTLL